MVRGSLSFITVMFVHCRSSAESRRLNVDRRSGVSMEVTVGGVTVVITDYKLKSSSATKSRTSTDSQSSRDTATTSSPDNHISYGGSPVEPSENDRVDSDWYTRQIIRSLVNFVVWSWYLLNVSRDIKS